MQIRLKRRWLLGCDLPESENHSPEKTEAEFLLESFLREDDIFYETMESRVEEPFGFGKNERVCNAVQQKESSFCINDVVRWLDVNLDSLTNKGLYLIAMVVTGGSTSFEKTRWKMKEVIRGSINRDSGKEKEDDFEKANVVKQLHQVLCDPGSFQKDCMMSSFNVSPPYHRTQTDIQLTFF